MSKVALATTSVVYILLLVNSASAQNMSNQTMNGMNMTNVTGAASVNGLAKVIILDAIKSLESGNITSALVELTAAKQAMAQVFDQAKMHFNEGMKAFTDGDSNSALMHLKAGLYFLG